jgi:hypothetical protein
MSKQTKKKRKKKSVLLSVAKPVNVEQGEEDAKEGDEPAEAPTRQLDPFAKGAQRWVRA